MGKTKGASSKIATCWCLHDDHGHLDLSVRSFRGVGQHFAVITRTAWNGTTGNWERCANLAESLGMCVTLGDWPSEQLHRRAALDVLKAEHVDYAFIPDGDEVIAPELLAKLLIIAEQKLADRVYVQMDTYWKSSEFVIRPRERLEPVILINPKVVEQVYIREYKGGTRIVLDASCGVLHHLSYAGSDERIKRKIETWGHRNELVAGWYDQVWKAWDTDPLLRNIHPTHPEAYGFAERIPVPEILRREQDQISPVKLVKNWPTVSVIIPVHNGPEDIRVCLQTLGKLQDLLHEVIVIDNNSDEATKQAIAEFPFAKVLTQDQNLGFGKASNLGVEASSGYVIVFLNSDTAVPRAGLVALVESLLQSGSIAAAGPTSNHVGYYQRIDPTYTSLDTLDLFAEHWAKQHTPEKDVEMLVGFCLAVRRSVLNEVGLFDERFGLGLFEDNDLCYRMQRAGYRLRLASRAFVHHTGSRTIARLLPTPQTLLEHNGALFRSKWKQDLDSGFVSALPGFDKLNGTLVFDHSKDPVSPNSEVARLREQADISLCMIVRNEEKVLRACLESVKPFFKEIILMDTGSTDRTVEIAKDCGAIVSEIPWPDSFAEARNASIAPAKGKWIFWLDADDTLPWQTGLSVLHSAIQAPPHIAGFVVPVQFTDSPVSGGTRVDHVKLFRNLPDLYFEGRIHEQILQSLRPHGEIARIDGVVLHSGYDTTNAGQARKRIRDWKLLQLDLQDRPDHPFVLFNYGMTHHFCDQHTEAIDYLHRCIQASQNHESHIRKAYALLGLSYKKLGDVDQARLYFNEGLELVGEDPELRFHLGMMAAEQGQLEDARDHYELITDNLEGHFSSVDIGILTYKKDYNLGTVYLMLEQYEKAKEAYGRAISAVPEFLEAADALHNAAMQAGDLIEAKKARDHVAAVEGCNVRWAEMTWDIQASVEGFEQAGIYLQALADRLPNPQACKLVLARKLLRNNREPEALPTLIELANSGDAESCFYLGVAANRVQNYPLALHWMERAYEIDPHHADTVQQIELLKAVVKN